MFWVSKLNQKKERQPQALITVVHFLWQIAPSKSATKLLMPAGKQTKSPTTATNATKIYTRLRLFPIAQKRDALKQFVVSCTESPDAFRRAKQQQRKKLCQLTTLLQLGKTLRPGCTLSIQAVFAGSANEAPGASLLDVPFA